MEKYARSDVLSLHHVRRVADRVLDVAEELVVLGDVARAGGAQLPRLELEARQEVAELEPGLGRDRAVGEVRAHAVEEADLVGELQPAGHDDVGAALEGDDAVLDHVR